MYKHIPEDIHVKALSEAFTLTNVETIAEKYDISESVSENSLDACKIAILEAKIS
jgi:hypothetical protein